MLALCTSLLLSGFAQEPEEVAPDTHAIEGEVLDHLGDPVPVADVWVTGADHPGVTLARGIADGSGVFRIGRVPERASWIVHAAAPGLCEVAVEVEPSWPVACLRLFDAATLRGTWLDAQGNPVAGGEVVASFEAARALRHTRPTAVTAAAGRFELTGVPLGMIDVRASAPHAGCAAARVHVRGDMEVRLTPARAATARDAAAHAPAASIEIAGNLLDARGAPLPGVRLALRAAGATRGSEAVTRGDGSFRFATDASPGTACVVHSLTRCWVLLPREEEGMRGASDATRLGCLEAKIDPEQPLSLRAEPACSVAGSVRAAGGGPARFAEVTLEIADPQLVVGWGRRATIRTDGEGRYRFSGQPAAANEARVVVRDPSGCGASTGFALVNGADVVLPLLELAPAGTVAGVIFDGAGKPLPGVRVRLDAWRLVINMEHTVELDEVITDRAGRYRFPGLAPGGYRLELLLTKKGGHAFAGSPFEVFAAETTVFDLTFR